MPSTLGDPWTTVANARMLQQMREIANRGSTLHLRINWLRSTELRHRKSGPIRHLHAFACQQRSCVLGFPHTELGMVVPPIPGEAACKL